MTNYYAPDSCATPKFPRRGRVAKLAEPTLDLIERAARVHARRITNPSLTPAERIEAAECLASLQAQFRVQAGTELQVAA